MPDIHLVLQEPTTDERELMEPRIDTFIFPNHPTSEEEKAAYDKAVTFQINHEKTLAAMTGDVPLPQGVTAFDIGNFSMNFASGSFDNALTRQTICPSAYGVLLRAGLLYKGLEGACDHGPD